MSTTSTAIAWTDATWNPLRGCSRVSTGCEHCYAERQAGRFSGAGQPYAGLVRKTAQGWHWTGAVRLVATDLVTPLRWTKPRRIFVNSMSDLFQDAVSEDLIDAILAVMALAPQHTFQVLTKRPARMLAYLTERWSPARSAEMPRADRHQQILTAAARLLHGPLSAQARFWTPDGRPRSHVQPWPLPNVWLGVSVENQDTADARLPWLLQTPAALRFVSYEPALAAVDLAPYLDGQGWTTAGAPRGLDWVIVGGESGPHARPCDRAWLRSVVQQCQAAQVPCFVKQLGARSVQAPRPDGATGYVLALTDGQSADPAVWPADLRVQQWPEGAHA